MINSSLARAFVFLGLIASAQARPLALVGGRLIDGFGGHPLANSVIIIENERITAVGTVGALQVPPDAEVISTEGMTVLPGLWDCHVHTMLLGHSDYDHWDKTYPKRLASEIMPAAAQQLLLAGVLVIGASVALGTATLLLIVALLIPQVPRILPAAARLM